MARERPARWYVLENLLNPIEWAMTFSKEMVVETTDFKSTVNIDDLVKRRCIRPATDAEVHKFDKKFPISASEENEHVAKMKDFAKGLASERRMAKHWSQKARLCRQWLIRLAQHEQEFQEVFGTFARTLMPTREQELAQSVALCRAWKRKYEPCRLLKQQLKPLVELLAVEGEAFSDLPPTPLIELQKGLGGSTLTIYRGVADEYLDRLRLKFLNREPRPGVWSAVKHKWRAIVLGLTGLAAITGVIATLLRNSKEIRDDVKHLPLTQP